MLIAEIFIRATRSYRSLEAKRLASLQFEPSLFSRTVLKANQDCRDDEDLYHISERGYRGVPFSVKKREGAIRIVFLGGSMVFNVHTTEGKDWPALVGQRLREGGLTQVEVINAGVPGHASFDSLGRLYAEIWMYEPDYVCICNAWNDIKYFRKLSDETPLLRAIRPYEPKRDPRIYYRNPVDEVLCKTSQLYMRARQKYYDVTLHAGEEGAIEEGALKTEFNPLGLKQYRMNMRVFADAVRDAGGEPIFITQPTLAARSLSKKDRKKVQYEMPMLTNDALVDAFEACRGVVLEVAKEKSAPAIDLYPELSGRRELYRDQVHTTPEGNEEIARRVSTSLVEIIRKKMGDPIASPASAVP